MTESRLDCSNAVVNIPDKPSNSFSPVSLMKSTTAMGIGGVLSASWATNIKMTNTIIATNTGMAILKYRFLSSWIGLVGLTEDSSLRKLKSSFIQYQRVWRILKRPTMEEFKTVSKVSAVGLLVIGALGFVISTIMAVAL